VREEILSRIRAVVPFPKQKATARSVRHTQKNRLFYDRVCGGIRAGKRRGRVLPERSQICTTGLNCFSCRGWQAIGAPHWIGYRLFQPGSTTLTAASRRRRAADASKKGGRSARLKRWVTEIGLPPRRTCGLSAFGAARRRVPTPRFCAEMRHNSRSRCVS
jgi:hypothetical protein